MNMLKRSLAMMLVLCMLFSMAPITAFAEETTDPAGTAMPAADGDLGNNIPDADQPDADQPDADQPGDDQPNADQPDADQPDVGQPDADQPDADQPDADQPDAEDPAADEDAEATDSTEDPYGIAQADFEPADATLSYADTHRILHLDCGRKYFSAAWIKALINEMAAAGYTHLQLAFGNDGLRFLLDDMTVNANGTTYASDRVKAGINLGNRNYYNAGDKNELTQAEMDDIIAHANTMGIGIIPHVNMPGHMDALVDAIEYVGISNAHFTGYTTSVRSLELRNDTAVAFTKALLKKYVDYFKSKGCSYFHIGADEFANDAYYGSMGFPSMGSSLYTKFANFVNDCAAIVKTAGMTPRAWNDGISYTQYTDSFDTDIQITYWSAGWGGYNVAPASALRKNGHAMINTHGDYYFILTSTGITNPSNSALNFNNTSFPGSTISDPVGSMFCIWCDAPGSASEERVAEAVRITLRKIAAAMQGTNSYSSEVVAGGFNVDGSVNGATPEPAPQPVTVTDQSTNVSATAVGLTDLTAPVTTAPVIEGAAEGKVLAWEMKPVTADGQYTGEAVVAVPVPDGWDAARMGAFVVENGGTVKLLSGSVNKDGKFEFTMPHFSVGGVYETAPAAEGDTPITDNRTINLILGETKTDAIEGGNYAGTYTTDPAGIASVTAEYEQVEGGMGPVQVTDISVGSAYYLSDGNGKYLTSTAQWATDINAAAQWTYIEDYGEYYLATNNKTTWLYYDKNNGWSVSSYGDPFVFSSGALAHYYFTDAKLIPYIISGTAAVNQTTVTFTGTTVGSATVEVGPVRYTVNVKYVEKTINIVKNGTRSEEQSVVVADYMDVTSMTNDYVTATWSGNTVTFTAKNRTGSVEMIIGNTKYTVNVIEENLAEVADLVIEYWQTNAKAEEQRNNGVTEKTVTAASAYSEAGITLTSIIPVNTYKVGVAASDPALGYWRTRLLLRSTNEQTRADGDDESLNGTGITKVRYWNGSWAVYTDAGQWQEIIPANYQLVAYYMNDMRLADEVSVSTSDWGKKGNGDFGGTYLGPDNVSLAFQIVYEGGTTAPAGTGVELAPYTYFVDAWGNRGVGAVAINKLADYEIWKITAETGEHSITHNGNYSPVTVKGFTWDGNEMTIWEDPENPVDHYTIINPTNNPNTEGYYDNLRWNEYNESILIRIYIKAEETEDSLKVVYYDEKFGDTLVEYNVIVPDGSNFNNGIVVANTKTPATLPAFKDNANRKDATGYGIVNALDKTQNFRTDLTQVPEAVGKYNNGLYTYTGSVVSEDGMTITHYYTINTSTLSPNFVADFGLPLSFPLVQVIGENQETLVESVSVNGKTRYGTLSYNPTTKIFTYTPTEILQNIDVLSINIKFKTEAEATLTNVGVTPATTVYYGEQFLNFSGGWTSVGTYANNGEQEAEILGDSTYYGYDSAYANTSGASDGTARKSVTIGNTATFTFTGTGIQVFANSTSGTGYVSVMVKNKDTGAIANVSMVDTDLKGTAGTDTTGGQISKNLSGLPVVSLVDLTGLPHATYDVTISKIMDTDPVYIDGIRVFGTVDETKYTVETNPYTADEEDAPDFYEVRDMVLTAMNITADDSVDYKTLYDQVYASTAGASAIITNASADYGSENRQDLLDNGPKNELYLFNGDTLTMNVSTDRVIQLGLKAPEGSASFTLNGDAKTLNSTVDMFYKIADKGGTTHTITITNTGDKILSVTLLKICDDPNVSFPALTEANIRAILADVGYTEESEAPTYTMVELKGTDVLIDGTVFDYTGEAIEPAITVNVGGTQLVEGKDYSVTYTNNVEPGIATVTIRGIATASETLGYTGEVSIDYTINAPAEPEVPEETTRPTEPTKPGNGNNKPTEPTKPGNGNNKPTEPTKPDNGNKPGQNKPGKDERESKKVATLKITFVNLLGKKVGTATLTKTQTANGLCVFSASEITAQAPAGKYAMWFFSVIVPYGESDTIIVSVI